MIPLNCIIDDSIVKKDNDNILMTPMVSVMESLDEINELCNRIQLMSKGLTLESDSISLDQLAMEGVTVYSIHTAVGKTKKDGSYKEGSVDLNVSIDLIEEIWAALRRLVNKVAQSLKDLFRHIFEFFSDKVFNLGNKILVDHIDDIRRYYNQKDKTVMAKLHKYEISNPVESFIKDSDVLKNNIPELCEQAQKYAENFSAEITAKKIVDAALTIDKEDRAIAKIKKTINKTIFSDGKYNEISQEISHESISKYVNKKYFGDEKKQTIEQPVNNVIPSPELFQRLVGRDSYTEFKTFQRSSEKAINTITKELAVMSSYYMTKDYRITTKVIGVRSNLLSNYLKLMLQTIIAYWNLFFTFRSDAIKAARAIINNSVENNE